MTIQYFKEKREYLTESISTVFDRIVSFIQNNKEIVNFIKKEDINFLNSKDVSDTRSELVGFIEKNYGKKLYYLYKEKDKEKFVDSEGKEKNFSRFSTKELDQTSKTIPTGYARNLANSTVNKLTSSLEISPEKAKLLLSAFIEVLKIEKAKDSKSNASSLRAVNGQKTEISTFKAIIDALSQKGRSVKDITPSNRINGASDSESKKISLELSKRIENNEKIEDQIVRVDEKISTSNLFKNFFKEYKDFSMNDLRRFVSIKTNKKKLSELDKKDSQRANILKEWILKKINEAHLHKSDIQLYLNNKKIFIEVKNESGLYFELFKNSENSESENRLFIKFIQNWFPATFTRAIAKKISEDFFSKGNSYLCHDSKFYKIGSAIYHKDYAKNNVGRKKEAQLSISASFGADRIRIDYAAHFSSVVTVANSPLEFIEKILNNKEVAPKNFKDLTESYLNA